MTNKELLERYPFLKPRNRWIGKLIIQDEKEEEKLWTELDAMPHGWRIAFGEQMCEEIREELIKYDCLDKYRVVQIKEKFGQLCWYDNVAPGEVCDIIDKYIAISKKTCIQCGKPATLVSKGWISPYCDCVKESAWYKEERFMPIEKFYGGGII